jgi:hypothetical protein
MAKHSRILWFLIAVVVPIPSWATYSCTGTLDWVATDPNGTVTVSSSSSGLGVFYPCSIGTVMYGVSTDACKGMLALLMMARSTGANVTWFFSDSLNCNRSAYNGGNWYWLNAAPSAYYFGPLVQ